MTFLFTKPKDIESLEELEKKVSYYEKAFKRFLYTCEKINYIPTSDIYTIFPNKYFKVYIEVSNKDIAYPIVEEIYNQRGGRNDGE